MKTIGAKNDMAWDEEWWSNSKCLAETCALEYRRRQQFSAGYSHAPVMLMISFAGELHDAFENSTIPKGVLHANSLAPASTAAKCAEDQLWVAKNQMTELLNATVSKDAFGKLALNPQTYINDCIDQSCMMPVQMVSHLA
eukprot:8167748-Pyramimonas_sp.AAC.1